LAAELDVVLPKDLMLRKEGVAELARAGLYELPRFGPWREPRYKLAARLLKMSYAG
jgi:hypothetical protein